MNPRQLAPLRFALPALLLLGMAMPALAQKDHVRIDGKVKASGANQVTVEGQMDMDVVVHVARGTKIAIEGTAVREYLAPGVNVEFVADVNKSGQIPEPLPGLTVCTFTEGSQPTFSLDDPTLPSAKGKDALNKYLVRGTIKYFRKDELTITIPGKPGVPLPNGKPTPPTPAKTVKATLAPGAPIKVLVFDTSWAQPGDECSVSGTLGPNGEVRARTLKVTLAKPVAPKEEESPKGKKPASR